MLNSRKLSALRSGNISLRYNDGFLITPSGKKYSSLKNFQRQTPDAYSNTSRRPNSMKAVNG